MKIENVMTTLRQNYNKLKIAYYKQNTLLYILKYGIYLRHLK